MKSHLTLLFLWTLALKLSGVSGSNPDFTCPQYVGEGSSLNCDCIAPSDVTSVPVLSWPGHSATSLLTVNDVRREMNGAEYTCQMIVNGVTTTAVYTLQVAYGPENVSIDMANPFATNGSSDLTLTCRALQVNPGPRFTWSGVNCKNGNQASTCVFQPQPILDNGKRVACLVTSSFVGMAVKSVHTISTLNLLYPPSTAPMMTSVDATEYLKTGDVINCTVTGGRPAVSAVIFRCSDPDLPDEADVIEVDGITGVTSVTSSVVVRTPGDGSQGISCLCYGQWAPGESMYSLTTTKLLPIEYSSSITNFTVNDVKTSLTVTENDVSSLQLTCSANGRPNPNVTLSKMGEEGVLAQSTDVTETSLTLPDVTCARTGVYVCSVSNGLSSMDQEVLTVNVLCGPKAFNSSSQSHNQLSPPSLSRRGVVFTVVANPTPDRYTYTAVNITSRSGGALIPKQISDLFRTTCSKVKDVGYLASCRVEPRRVTSEQLGTYTVTVSNRLGSYQFYFMVKEAMSASSRGRSSSDTVPIAALIGGIIAALVVIVIVVVVCFMVRKKGRAKKMGIIRSKRPVENDEFVEHINEAYVSADAIDVTLGNQSDPAAAGNDIQGASPRPHSHTAGSSVHDGNADDQSQARSGANTEGQKHVSVVNIRMENSPRNSPRYNAFGDVFSADRTQSNKGSSLAIDSDYAEIGSNASMTPRSKQARSEYAEIESPRRLAQKIDSPRTDSPRIDSPRKQKNPYAVPDCRVAPAPQGSVKGPLGDIYSVISKSPRNAQAKKLDKGWVQAEDGGSMGSPRERVNGQMGSEDNTNDAGHALPDRSDAQKPFRRNKLAPLRNGDSELYSEPASPRARMVCQRIGNPFAPHHISRALRRNVIPRSMPHSPRMIPVCRRGPEVRASMYVIHLHRHVPTPLRIVRWAFTCVPDVCVCTAYSCTKLLKRQSHLADSEQDRISSLHLSHF